VVKSLFKNIARLFRLWAVYARMDFLIVARDLKLFLIWSVSDLLMNIAGVLGLWLLVERFAGIGPWTKPAICFLLGYGAAMEGILATFCSYNILYVSRRLGRGQFDHTLIQPQPIWMSLLTEGFSPAFGLPTLLAGFALILWGLHLGAGTIPQTPGWWCALVLNLFASASVVVAFQFLWSTLAFYAPRSAEEVSSSTIGLMSQLKVFPLDGLGPIVAGTMLTVLPVGFVAWWPARALLGRQSPAAVPSLFSVAPPLYLTLAAAFVFWLLTVLVFKKGLRHYVRVGSSRYSTFGHRR